MPLECMCQYVGVCMSKDAWKKTCKTLEYQGQVGGALRMSLGRG